jgi:Flp pilus assembly protein TadG
LKLDRGLGRQANLLVRVARRALRLRGQDGSTLVEFAIIVPVLMSALTGMCSMGIAFYNFQQLANVCTNSVQYVANNQGLTADDDPCSAAKSQIIAALPSWTPASFTLSITLYDSSGVAHTPPSGTGTTFSCSTYASYLTSNEPVALNATYSYKLLPILGFKPATLSLATTQGALVQ